MRRLFYFFTAANYTGIIIVLITIGYNLLQSKCKSAKIQIYLVKQCLKQVYFFQRVKAPYARGRARSISKSQGGLP